eukprot:evm.model.scf_555EXC.5 EVM.evm.TU.scf_555EXC.5   scf_555EXC:31950-37019(+)
MARSRSHSRGRKRAPSRDRDRDGAKRRRERSRDRPDRDRDRKDRRDGAKVGRRDRRERSASRGRRKDRARGNRSASASDGSSSSPSRSPRRERKGDDAGKRGEGGIGSAGGVENGSLVGKVAREPLSLEELVRKREQQQKEEQKPMFLSKKQREELALKRRQSEVEGQRARAEEMKKAREAYLGNLARQRELERKRVEEERRQFQDEREREKEKELIRQQYLGQEKVKKRVLKPSEKFRFNFDWDVGDDTSRDLNPLYNTPHDAHLLFGRGLRAGIDRREQKKGAAQHEKELLQKLRSAAGLKETKESRKLDREREKAADKYDGFDMKTEKHWTEKDKEEMTERDWRIFKEDYNISFKGSGATPALPIRTWEEAHLPKPLMKAVVKAGFKKPTPIQMAAMPVGIQGRDMIGIAETGSGKTAAFVIPMLMYIQAQPVMTEELEAEGPYAVVLAPTRELAQQIEEEAVKLAHYTKYRMCSVVGGQPIEDQGYKLRKGCELVIATPGRLLDCLERRYAVLNQCNYVVLDEADRMIDMGFEPQVVGVLDAMPSTNLRPENEEAEGGSLKYRTTHMFSATMPSAVERLAKKYLRRPVVITIGTAGKATDNVSQRVIPCKENEKEHRLEQEMSKLHEKRAIVFVNTKAKCDVVYRRLEAMGYSCTVLHGGKTQEQREASIKGFRDDAYNILIATDVAGRGIDVPDVALVINYDMPNNIEMYTHRIGRTGRAGRKGVAITFLTMGEAEQPVLYDLKKVLEECGVSVPPELARHPKAQVKPGTIEQRPRRKEQLFAA